MSDKTKIELVGITASDASALIQGINEDEGKDGKQFYIKTKDVERDPEGDLRINGTITSSGEKNSSAS